MPQFPETMVRLAATIAALADLYRDRTLSLERMAQAESDVRFILAARDPVFRFDAARLRGVLESLDDLKNGFRHDEIGLPRLLRSLVGAARSQGYDDGGAWDTEITRDIPVNPVDLYARATFAAWFSPHNLAQHEEGSGHHRRLDDVPLEFRDAEMCLAAVPFHDAEIHDRYWGGSERMTPILALVPADLFTRELCAQAVAVDPRNLAYVPEAWR